MAIIKKCLTDSADSIEKIASVRRGRRTPVGRTRMPSGKISETIFRADDCIISARQLMGRKGIETLTADAYARPKSEGEGWLPVTCNHHGGCRDAD
jgi:hypothetical protein